MIIYYDKLLAALSLTKNVYAVDQHCFHTQKKNPRGNSVHAFNSVFSMSLLFIEGCRHLIYFRFLFVQVEVWTLSRLLQYLIYFKTQAISFFLYTENINLKDLCNHFFVTITVVFMFIHDQDNAQKHLFTRCTDAVPVLRLK